MGNSVTRMWNRLLMRRYRKSQERQAQGDRDAERRLGQLEEGIRSYGRPGPGAST